MNAAGTNFDSLLLRCNLKQIEDTIKTNLFGAIYTSQAALKDMLKEREGVTINIGSVVGVKGNAGQCVHAASKSGSTKELQLPWCKLIIRTSGVLRRTVVGVN